jgi:hypothetical protein
MQVFALLRMIFPDFALIWPLSEGDDLPIATCPSAGCCSEIEGGNRRLRWGFSESQVPGAYRTASLSRPFPVDNEHAQLKTVGAV